MVPMTKSIYNLLLFLDKSCQLYFLYIQGKDFVYTHIHSCMGPINIFGCLQQIVIPTQISKFGPKTSIKFMGAHCF